VESTENLSPSPPSGITTDPKLPFDIAGRAVLRRQFKAIFMDAIDSNPPYVTFNGAVSVAAHRSKNGLDWFTYKLPSVSNRRHIVVIGVAAEEQPEYQVNWSAAMQASLQESDAVLFVNDDVRDNLKEIKQHGMLLHVAFPSEISAGTGMEPLNKVLTPLQRVQLAHVRGGHRSIQAMMLDQRHSTGMPLLTTAAMKEFASIGCDLCNAFKMKLMRPREKPVDNEADDESRTCGKLVMDQYGPVATSSMVRDTSSTHTSSSGWHHTRQAWRLCAAALRYRPKPSIRKRRRWWLRA
jgi:hypothetical protein